MGIYDVAVWVRWSTEVLPYTAELEAASPVEAVVAVMRVNGLERLEHAAVKLPDSSFVRWEDGMTLSCEEKAMAVEWRGRGVTQRKTQKTVQPLLLTIPQVAATLGLGRTKVYELIANEGLPCVKFGTARRVYMIS